MNKVAIKPHINYSTLVDLSPSIYKYEIYVNYAYIISSNEESGEGDEQIPWHAKENPADRSRHLVIVVGEER